jgi:hypothetical protein
MRGGGYGAAEDDGEQDAQQGEHARGGPAPALNGRTG